MSSEDEGIRQTSNSSNPVSERSSFSSIDGPVVDDFPFYNYDLPIALTARSR